ncbi:hypothetical protein [Burkholderia cepacia]|uniref:hypothetical protein n=1 Tax=Burkholderia cepacia TaxID=292 RepID=UPI002AB5E3A6|nr:hypothetical protein [Burkholderia cepacia]
MGNLDCNTSIADRIAPWIVAFLLLVAAFAGGISYMLADRILAVARRDFGWAGIGLALLTAGGIVVYPMVIFVKISKR